MTQWKLVPVAADDAMIDATCVVRNPKASVEANSRNTWRAMLTAAPEAPDVVGALESAASWLERWGTHVGNCSRVPQTCTCGLTFVRNETHLVLSQLKGEEA